MGEKSNKFICFVLGLVLGNKALPILMHLIYIGIIVSLIIWKK